MEFDFGLTELGRIFHMDWWLSAETPEELVRRWADPLGENEYGLEELRLLREDVQLLLASPLSDDEIHALWMAAANFYPESPVEGEAAPRGRAWLAEIDRELQPHLQGFAYEPSGVATANESTLAVLVALAERLTPRAEFPLEPSSARDVAAAVERCAREASAALAFRFLLCAYVAYNSPVSSEAWSSFEELNQSFGYGKFILEMIEGYREN
ncbi:hypothetical protein [Streptomyces sp. NPDC021096]|uniref:hypothetical protein n=1 Tax=Streptomyces sp. NPDC021096 TaxID=3154792 RepID=UPI0033C2BEDE